MNKSNLVNFIKKYYLGGAVDHCTMWDVKKKTLFTKFMSKDKNLLGNVTLKSFDYGDVSFPVYDASVLLKLLGLLGDDFDMSFSSIDGKLKKMKMSDGNCTVDYALAESTLVPDVKSLKKTPNADLSIDMTPEFIQKFIKAKSAIGNDPENDNFAIVPIEKDMVNIVLGYSSNVNTNQINLPINVNIPTKFDTPILFSASLLKSVLDNNSEAESVKMNVDNGGLGTILIDSDLFTANYYFVSLGYGSKNKE